MKRFLLFILCTSIVTIDASAQRVTFTKDVAPIFFEHCVACHRPDEIAPMSLLTYESARPWAKSIAKAVGNKDMPPWSGDSDHRKWSNDISLNDEQIETIVKWVEQGAREGDPKALPEPPTFPETWVLGEPDYIVHLSEVVVPADGEDLFPKETIEIEIDEQQWVRAIEFMPGDRRVAHHIQTTYNNGKVKTGALDGAQVGILAIWTAGMSPFEFPEGVGRILSPGARINVDSHYHPYGEATTDNTRIGLYFGKGELKKEVSTLSVANMGIRIPPGAAAHPETAFHVFDRDMQILAFSPHLHVRGKSMRYDLTYPDGRVETLLDVPKYNFNWQWQYYPTEPIDVPAGSRVDVTGVWNNSEGNPFNPDPTQEIIYRGNTFNEMFVGFMEVIEKDGVYLNPPVAKDKLIDLLKAHPADESFYFGGFLPFGVYAPKEPGKEGMMYIVNGSIMFTISLDDFFWDGDHLTINTQLPTPEASATTTTVTGELNDKGQLKGTLHYGIDSPRPLKVPALGVPMSQLN
ncbi:MAG: cytochrome c [Candidatus Hydrogenedentota bacterium]